MIIDHTLHVHVVPLYVHVIIDHTLHVNDVIIDHTLHVHVLSSYVHVIIIILPLYFIYYMVS